MDLTKILSISGRRGLFRVVSQLKNAVLVESLIDKKRFPAFAHEKISTLEEIAIFTTGEDLPLKEILERMFKKHEGKPLDDLKTDDLFMKSYFLEIVPDFDQERVYTSDIRKIVTWYNLLLEHHLLDFTEKEEEKKENEDTVKEGVKGKDSEAESAPPGINKTTAGGDTKGERPAGTRKSITRKSK